MVESFFGGPRASAQSSRAYLSVANAIAPTERRAYQTDRLELGGIG